MGQIGQCMFVSLELVRFFVFGDGLFKLATEFERLTQVPMCEAEVRVQFEGFLKLSDRFGITSRDNVQVSQVGVDDCRKRIKLNRTPYLSYGTVELTQCRKNGVAKGIMRECVVGI